MLTEADIERMADEAANGPIPTELLAGDFLREFKGGFDSQIVGPMFAIWLDSNLDKGLARAAEELGESEATLMRRAVSEYIDRPPTTAGPQPEADITGWQWVLHLDDQLAKRLRLNSAATDCHINVVVNRAVGWLLETL